MATTVSRRTLLGACAVVLASRSAMAAALRLLSYHNQPPFMMTSATGLTFDLAHYLEARLELPVSTEIIPRNRLDRELLTGGNSVMIPWVSPTWFPSMVLAGATFSPPLMTDENVVISNAKKPIEYADVTSLIGYRMGVVTGRVHKDIDQLVAQGKIQVSNARTPILNLEMLASGRVDFVVMPSSTWRVLVPDERQAVFYVAKKSQEKFTRHIMFSRTADILIDKMRVVVIAMKNDAAWRRTLQAYNLDEPSFAPLPT